MHNTFLCQQVLLIFIFLPSPSLQSKTLEVLPIFAGPWPAARRRDRRGSDILHPSTPSQRQMKPSSGPSGGADGPGVTLWSACCCSDLEFLLSVIYKYLFLSQIFRLWLYLPCITNMRSRVPVLVLLPAVVFVTDGN